MNVNERAYQGSFLIPPPQGVYQAAGDTNLSPEYAYRAHNIRTERGLLASSHGVSRALPALGEPIDTLTRFYRRSRPDDPQVFVAAAAGKIYTYTMGDEGWVLRAEGFASSRWSDVTYETVENGQTVDILILSNDKDGMIAVYGSDLRVERKALTIGEEHAQVKFAQLGRYAERIWGTGAPGYPDSVFYSRPYDPFDWTDVPQTPELGGGVIAQPTWDGDSFIALHRFGGYLLAVKRTSVFEIRGTDPASFVITQAFGTDGPLEARTIAVGMQSMLFLSQGGIGLYDGTALRLLSRDALYETMRMRDQDRLSLATACMCGPYYYLALCVKGEGGTAAAQNNCVIEYDTQRGTFMLRKGLRVRDFYALGGRVFFTRADSPYEVLELGDENARGYLDEPMESLWQTPWLDLGKAYKKQDFLLRFTAEADEDDVPLDITIRTERRAKTRTVLLSRRRKDLRVKFALSGARVQLEIRSHARAAGWRIYGGVQAEYALCEA